MPSSAQAPCTGGAALDELAVGAVAIDLPQEKRIVGWNGHEECEPVGLGAREARPHLGRLRR
eukprot:5845426-Prymnesium_polylepis.2